MKVVIDYQIFSSQLYGGISRYFVELANHLVSIDSTAPVVLAPLNYNMYFTDLDPAIAIGKHIPKLPLSGKLARLLNRVASRLWLMKKKPELVHATYYNHKRNFYNKNAKIVITVHDMIHELFPEDFPPIDQTAQLKQAAVAMADHVICVSENTRDDLIRLTGVDSNKVSVVHHGISEISSNLSPVHPLPAAPYLLFVGKRSGYKNYSGLLKAYATCPELNGTFKLVCFGGGRFTTDELDKHAQLNLAKADVLWYGGDDSALASLYKNATAFVYPSLYEGFGIPPLEAMSFDCPVICSDKGSIPEVVGDAGEYFDPLNTPSIVEAITRVVNDRLYADELRKRGRRQIKKYSWQRCAKETSDVYKTLI